MLAMHKLTSLNFKYGEKFMYTVYYLHHYRTIPFFKKKKKKYAVVWWGGVMAFANIFVSSGAYCKYGDSSSSGILL